jgi:hypothetical protein
MRRARMLSLLEGSHIERDGETEIRRYFRQMGDG